MCSNTRSHVTMHAIDMIESLRDNGVQPGSSVFLPGNCSIFAQFTDINRKHTDISLDRFYWTNNVTNHNNIV